MSKETLSVFIVAMQIFHLLLIACIKDPQIMLKENSLIL